VLAGALPLPPPNVNNPDDPDLNVEDVVVAAGELIPSRKIEGISAGAAEVFCCVEVAAVEEPN
jgi:hypothetical protein